ncbi:MAG TPA: glycosyltransferase family 4 protein [Kofleriaceae bacterium]
MRILSFTGGAGNMYCGSCLRDNALASALLARGHDVVLTPVYTPTRTDERNVSQHRVAFGGISVFLEQYSSLFRHTPRALDRLWDAEWVIRMASKRQIKVDPKSLGELTVSMLRGGQGFQRKEIDKLLEWLRTEPKFDVINLPYTLLIGLAETLRRELGTPICCTLQGEDLFLDGLGEPWRQQSLDLIRTASAHVDLFLPVSRYYLDYMPGFLGIPREKMRMVPLGINTDGFGPRASRPPGPFTIGYFARIAPEKGLHVLAEAYRRLRARPDVGESRLVAAGYLAPEHRDYFDRIVADLRSWGLGDQFEYRGEVDRQQKIAFLRGLDVLSVPTPYEEPKGMFLLEAMANGVPVVQPRRGAFPEIIDTTGGGLIVEPDDPEALVEAWLDLWRNPERAAAIGAAGVRGVREHYTVDRMAESVERIYAELAGSGRSRAAS